MSKSTIHTIDSVDMKRPIVAGQPVKDTTKTEPVFNYYPAENYELNTESNAFLKEYLIGKAQSKGVNIPEGMKINISNYKFDEKYTSILHKLNNFLVGSEKSTASIIKYCDEHGMSEEEKTKLLDLYRFYDVRVNIFGARIGDMFKLLAKDKQEVEERVQNMVLSGEDKQKILDLKDFFDKYYKVEAEYNGQVIDLLHLNADSKAKLREISPEFADFMEDEEGTLKNHTIDFAQKEMKHFELSEAGSNSKWAAGGLLAVLGFSLFRAWNGARKTKEEMEMAKKFMNYVKENPEEGNKILDKCVAKYEKICSKEIIKIEKTDTFWKKLGKIRKSMKYSSEDKAMDVIGKYMKKIGMEGGEHFVKNVSTYGEGKMPGLVRPIKSLKGKGKAAILSIIGLTIAGSLDDCLGAGKDYVQDRDNFGSKTAGKIAGLSVLGGI